MAKYIIYEGPNFAKAVTGLKENDPIEQYKKYFITLFNLFYFKNWANPGLFFVYFRYFQQQFYRKNCRLQRESNSDRRSRRRAR